jgi:hypothetical protein
MKIIIRKGIDKDGKNYRQIYYQYDSGTEEKASDQLSRMLTHTDSGDYREVFEENFLGIRLTKGEQKLKLTDITPDMDDITRAKIIAERIKTAREWADHIAVEIQTTVDG